MHHSRFLYIFDSDTEPTKPVRSCRLFGKDRLRDRVAALRISAPEAESFGDNNGWFIWSNRPVREYSPTVMVKVNGHWKARNDLIREWLRFEFKMADIERRMSQEGYIISDIGFITTKQYEYLTKNYETAKLLKQLPSDDDIRKGTL